MIKEGSRVKYIRIGSQDIGYYPPVNTLGTVIEVDERRLFVHWDKGTNGDGKWWCDIEEVAEEFKTECIVDSENKLSKYYHLDAERQQIKENSYVKQAQDFLKSCGAEMKIAYLGKECNDNWSDGIMRNTYRATIKTPRGTMWVKFWDSEHNTKNGIMPTEYDILACLQKYEVGSFEDFVSEFGYDIEFPVDRQRAKAIYKAVVKEYEKICRCFTEDQIKAMWEIA